MATATVSGTARPKKGSSTLGLLRTARISILILDALLFLAVVSATEVHRAALKTVAKDTAPTIIAAQDIKSAVADMDADAADELLQAPRASTALLQSFETRRVEAARAIVATAENITFGDAERMPIQSLQVGLGSYERLVQRARDLHERDDASAVATYREAADVLDTVLLPAAEALDRGNDDLLERTYRAGTFRSSGTRFLIVFAGLILLGVLASAQTMLSQRMHRTFNLPLLAATFAVCAVSLFAVRAVSRSHEGLREAKEDAFATVHALWRARAAAYAANSEESRSLLDPAHAAEHQGRLRSDTDAVANLPAGLSPEQLLAAIREQRHIDGFSGYLADEVSHATFAGEREAAWKTMDTWQRYAALTAQVRLLERAGQHRKALELCTGTGEGQAGRAFQDFDEALGQALAIDQSAFDAATNRAGWALSGLEAETAFAAGIIAVLVVAGFAPRIREYQ